MSTPNYTLEPQEKVDATRKSIENRLADINDFFETGDFNGTVDVSTQKEFEYFLRRLESFTDYLGITGTIGKDSN